MTMKARSFFTVVYMSMFLCVGLYPAGAEAQTARPSQSGPASLADLVDDLLPAVVNISSTQQISDPEDMPAIPDFPPGSPFEDFFEEFMQRKGRSGPAIPPSSLGSGFIIDAEKGYVVTNNHVIQKSDEVRVTFHDDETIEAEVIGYDDKTDLAVLKIDTTKKLTEVTFGKSGKMRIGDWVVAIGNPFGLGGTVTTGIISAQQRNINAGPYDDFIQTDASINRGNSGGPMFNTRGEVIGINTAIFSPSGGSVGIGFAIPSDLAKPIIDQLIKYGKTRRGWLGVRIQHVTEEIAESLGLNKKMGALVASTTAGGPAEEAGIKAGDIILSFNGQDIDEMSALPRIVAETEIGSAVEVTLWRNGKKVTRDVKVGELEKAEKEGLLDAESTEGLDTTEIEDLGLSLTALTDQTRNDFNIAPGIEGVLIAEVTDMSEAANKRLLPGDVILEINQQPVRTPEDVREIITKAKEANRGSVLFLIHRDGNRRFFALRLNHS